MALEERSNPTSQEFKNGFGRECHWESDHSSHVLRTDINIPQETLITRSPSHREATENVVLPPGTSWSVGFRSQEITRSK